MVGFTAAAAIIGLGSMAYGTYEKEQGKDAAAAGYAKQQEGYALQAQAARDQAQISREQAASSVQYAGQERDINVLASQQSVAASNASLAINQNIVSSEQNTEAQKRQGMELDARRNQLEIIRNQQRGRALALTSANAQGAAKGSSLQGGYGQISGQTGVNILGVQQNLQIGRNIFDNNANVSTQKLAQASLENQYAIQQAANQTAKSNLVYDYAVTNAAYTTRQANSQELAARGGGTVSQGNGMTNIGNSQIASGNSYFSAGPSIFSAGTNLDKLSGSDFFGLNSFSNLMQYGPTGYGWK